MKRLCLILTTLFLSLAAIEIAADDPAETRATMLKAVVHVNYEDVDRQKKMLGNLENILKAEPQGEIVVVAHGGGITLVQKSRTKHAPQVQALIQHGVRFAGCENTMKKENIEKADLLDGVTTVPSGAVEVIKRQQAGFGYFRP